MNVLRTVIVPAAQASKGRQLGKEVDKHGDGMFTTAMCRTHKVLVGADAEGNPIYETQEIDGTISHYVSSGIIQDQFAAALNDGLMLHAAAVAGAKAQGIVKKSTEADATGLPPASVVHDGHHPDTGEPETPHELFARLNLKIVSFPLTP